MTGARTRNDVPNAVAASGRQRRRRIHALRTSENSPLVGFFPGVSVRLSVPAAAERSLYAPVARLTRYEKLVGVGSELVVLGADKDSVMTPLALARRMVPVAASSRTAPMPLPVRRKSPNPVRAALVAASE